MTTPATTTAQTETSAHAGEGEEFEALLISDDLDPGYGVIVPALPGCLSQGDDREEALAMITEAIEGFLAIPYTRPHIPNDRKGQLIAEYTDDGCRVEVATVRVVV